LSDIHITRLVLRAVHRGDLPLSVLMEVGWRHLLDLCPTCDGEYRVWREERRPSRPPGIHPRDLEQFRREEKRVCRRFAAEAEDLMGLPLPERIEKIQRSHRRYRDIRLVARLLDESRRRMPADPQVAEELVDTAREVLLQARSSPDLTGMIALSAIYRANLARLQGRPDEARERFTRARAMLKSVTDLLLFGEVDIFEALLALDLCELGEARNLLKRSVAFFLLAAARERAAEPLRMLGRVYELGGEPERAAEVVRAAERVAAAEDGSP
jgi:hypothetical protein